MPQTRANALPPLDIAASGRLAGGRTSVDVTANAGGANSLRVTGSAPLTSDGALDLEDRRPARRRARQQRFVSFRPPDDRRAHARASVARDGRQTPGARVGPVWRMASSATTQTGFRLTGITGVLIANGDTIRIDRLSGATPDGGTISATGDLRLDPAAGFPGSIRVTGRHAQVVANSVVAATADLALTVSGKLAQKPNVDGRITIDLDGHHRAGALQQRLRSHSWHEACQSDADRRARASPRSPRPTRRAVERRCSTRRSTSRFRRPTAFSSAAAASMPRSAAICMSPGSARDPAGERRLRPLARLAHADRPAARLHPGASPVSRRRDPRPRPRRRDDRERTSPRASR